MVLKWAISSGDGLLFFIIFIELGPGEVAADGIDDKKEEGKNEDD